jgi:DNA-binding PadR family transcriptional regulator
MSLRHAILGLLSMRPMSGYELNRVIDASVGHFWSADQSQIYRALASLVDSGLASRDTVVQEGRPNLHVHRPTAAGLDELDRWLVTPRPRPPVREPFLARLFFVDRLGPGEARALLHERRRETTELLESLESIPQPTGTPALGDVLRMATLANGLAQARAELDWLDATERALDEVNR